MGANKQRGDGAGAGEMGMIGCVPEEIAERKI